MSEQIPAGWYPDPQATAPGAERWWNGGHWTAHTRRTDLLPPSQAGPATDPVRHPAPGNPDLVARIRAKPTVLPDGTPKGELTARLGAYVIDVLLVVIVAEVVSTLIAFALLLGLEDPLSGSWLLLSEWLDVIVIGGLWLGYQLLVGRRGATFGKRLLHLRARTLETDGPLTARQVVRRSVVGGGGVLCAMFPGSQFLGALLVAYDLYRMDGDEWGRPWHDQVAGTVVVRTPR